MNNFFLNKHKIILLIFSIVFFVLYNYLNFSVPGIFNSPDETANYVFTGTVAKENKLSYSLPQDYGELNEFIHPRSTYVEENGGKEILPVGFLGMPMMYGLIAKIVGMNAMVFLTSVLAILGVWAFYGIIKKIFNKEVAFYSSLLLFFQPVLFYYTARSMFHNVPSVSLLLIGIWFLLVNPLKMIIEHRFNRPALPAGRFERISMMVNDILGMSVFMLGILMRPNEIVWIGLAMCIVIIAYRKEISFSRLLTWIITSLIFIGLYAWFNIQVYGNPIGAYITSRSIGVSHWYSFLFPFGVSVGMIVRSVWFYFINIQWWYTVPALFGFAFFIFNWKKGILTRAQKIYAIVCIFVSSFLFIYYGSSADTLYSMKTIGVAYTRYWLPIFILMLPFVGSVWQGIAQKKRAWLLGVIVLSGMALLSYNAAFRGVDGILAVRGQLKYVELVKKDILASTQTHAIIVSDREDKFVWPERQVIVRFFDSRVGQALGKLVFAGNPVYYLTPKLDEAHYQNTVDYLGQFGLSLEEKMFFKDHTLYNLKVHSQ
ncbi:MAG: glycosyltransferase family 39 protein [Candidatus Magasanikbacteria bacterium]